MSAPGLIVVSSVAVAIILTLGVMRHTRRLWPPVAGQAQVRVMGVYSPVLSWLKVRWPSLNLEALTRLWQALPRRTLVELAAIAVWAAWVGRIYLDFNPFRWIPGGDWALNLEGYFPWTWLTQCGACVMWNGAINGGAPTFVELVSAVLHPIWVISIQLFGVVNASKVAVVAGLMMAGWAQWWLARTLRLGWLARFWSAALIVVGGHLAGRLDNGLVEELFPLGAASLALAAAVHLAVTGSRRAVAAFGLLLGLSMLSGQAYMQIGLVMCLFPGLALFLWTSRLQRRPLIKSFVVGALIALLVSSVLWVPLLHFWPNFVKPASDPAYTEMQSLELLALNLVVADRDFYEALRSAGLPGSPAWFANYIGWVPLLLAVVGLRAAPRRSLRWVAFALSGIALAYLVGSAILLKWLLPIVPGAVLSLRTPSVITGLAVPLIVALGALGVEALWGLNWPALVLSATNRAAPILSLRWLVVLPLLWSVHSAYMAGRQYMSLLEAPTSFYDLIGSTGLAARQWVSTPYGESELVVVALHSGLKVTDVVRPWLWKEHEPPAKHFEFTRQPVEGSGQAPINGLYQQAFADAHYAAVTQLEGAEPCDAEAVGGQINVTCRTETAGKLVIMENAWSGWRVWRDGRPVRLEPGRWLATAAPAGEHRYEFRYLPWDVPLGLLLSLLGLGWAVSLWIKPGRKRLVMPQA